MGICRLSCFQCCTAAFHYLFLHAKQRSSSVTRRASPTKDPTYFHLEYTGSSEMWPTFLTDVVDFLNQAESVYQLHGVQSEAVGRYVTRLYVVGCLVLALRMCYIIKCLIGTNTDASTFETMSVVATLIADTPQGYYNMFYAYSPLDPGTLFGLPDAAAVFAVTVVRLVVVIVGCACAYCKTTGPFSNNGVGDWQKGCRVVQAIVLIVNLVMAVIALK